jgi:hypothetical protein
MSVVEPLGREPHVHRLAVIDRDTRQVYLLPLSIVLHMIGDTDLMVCIIVIQFGNTRHGNSIHS